MGGRQQSFHLPVQLVEAFDQDASAKCYHRDRAAAAALANLSPEDRQRLIGMLQNTDPA